MEKKSLQIIRFHHLVANLTLIRQKNLFREVFKQKKSSLISIKLSLPLRRKIKDQQKKRLRLKSGQLVRHFLPRANQSHSSITKESTYIRILSSWNLFGHTIPCILIVHTKSLTGLLVRHNASLMKNGRQSKKLR